jgi:dienelactone hydrolase
MKRAKFTLLAGPLILLPISVLAAAAPSTPTPAADRLLADYFRAETARLAQRCLTNVATLEDWTRQRERYRQELLEMLGLSPLPARTDLKPVITGRLEHEALTVENLHFQSLPGLYVTANLYLPKGLTRPAPAVLYVCGHGAVITNQISYGNKVSYQHHGAWFARQGYVCLVIDSVQLGEILGLHHGTYREELWWWNARGYTPAGVEAWNSMRALDYLSTRPEVDTNRFGITGRSGGGAYSWFTAALDERIKAIAPVAGLTDLQNHVVDGTVEGHCDCMFFVNTYRWDYPLLAALCAPRPLLLVNSDTDSIFPLDGVMRTHAKIRQIYQLYKAADKFGLVIGPGPHRDTQDLQVPVFHWFNRHLKGEEPVISMAATKLFTAAQLRVLERLPADALNTNIHVSFVPAARPPLPRSSAQAWRDQGREWLEALQQKVFAGWPEAAPPLGLQQKFDVEKRGLRLAAFDFESQPSVPLRLYVLQRAGTKPERVVLTILGQAAGPAASGGADHRSGATFAGWLGAMRSAFAEELTEELAVAREAAPADDQALSSLAQRLEAGPQALAWVAPRGVGLGAWTADARKQTQIRRRFMLLGQTLDGMRVWDIRRAVQALRARPEGQAPLVLQAEGDLACDTLYAALFENGLAGLELWRLPASHQAGPDFLNVMRFLDVPQTLAMAMERCPVRLHQVNAGSWEFPQQTARALEWERDRLRIEP